MKVTPGSHNRNPAYCCEKAISTKEHTIFWVLAVPPFSAGFRWWSRSHTTDYRQVILLGREVIYLQVGWLRVWMVSGNWPKRHRSSSSCCCRREITRDALTRSAGTSTIFANRAPLLWDRRCDYCERTYIWGFTSKNRSCVVENARGGRHSSKESSPQNRES